MSKILIVLSAADTWTRADGSSYPSGVWAEELVAMDERFVEAGCEVDIATPGGTPPTIDPHSLDAGVVGAEPAARFGAYLEAISARLARPLVLADVETSAYDAVVIPGGHGPVEDLYKDPDMGRVLAEADRQGVIIAPVCHGQAALLAARRPDGGWLFEGRAMTAFSDEEEVELGTADNAPWLLAETLRKAGARYEKGPNWGPYVVRDGNLLSGQNPASSTPLADAVLAALADLAPAAGNRAVPSQGAPQHRGVVMTGDDGEEGRKAFYILVEARPGREDEVLRMLRDIRACVEDEPETGPWYAVRHSPTTFAIFEAFPSIAGRNAHVAGGGGDIFRDVARMNRILARPAQVQKVDVLLCKPAFA
ncbi:MAG: type 1 glutamine amidotransferase domain-containing protein [Caulobacterales bacterium]|nr:type 1 glutamine amidotransferase domain-containing protein [Caulobacterales bacterium]